MSVRSRKIGRFHAVAFFLGLGYACGYYAANSLLISRVGPASLLPVYLISALTTLAITLLLYSKVDHVPRQKLFIALFLGLAFIVAASWVAIDLFPSKKWIYYAVRIIFSPVYIIADLEYWLIASVYLNGAESRKHFPLFVSASILGEIAAGFLLDLGSTKIHTVNLPLIWVGILLLSPLMVLGLKFPESHSQGVGTSVIWGEMLAPGSGKRSRSPFATPLAVLLLIFWGTYAFFSHGTDYMYNVFAVRAVSGEDAVTAFFGKVSIIANIVVLGSQILLSFHIQSRLGLERIVFFIVLINLAAWVLIAASPSLLTVTTAQIAIYFFLDHFSVASLHTALNVIPDRIRGRIRLFTEGLGRPLGTVLYFICMAIFSMKNDTMRMVYLMLPLAVMMVPYAFCFRHYYVRHLLNLLRVQDPTVVSAAVYSLGRSHTKEGLSHLLQLLRTARPTELKQSIVQTLRTMRDKEAFQGILPYISAPNDRLRLTAIEAMNDYEEEEASQALLNLVKSPDKISFSSRQRALSVLKHHLGEQVLPVLTAYLQSEKDSRSIANTIETIGLIHEHRSLAGLAPYLQSDDNRIRANTAIAICLASGSEDSEQAAAVAVVEQLFHSTETRDRCAGIYAIGVLKLKKFEGELLELLNSENEKIREHACLALAGFKNPAFAPVFVRFLVGSGEQQAVHSASRIDSMPRWSRRLVFESLARLPENEQDLIRWRLKSTLLDFTEELELLGSSAPLPEGTVRDVANLKT